MSELLGGQAANYEPHAALYDAIKWHNRGFASIALAFGPTVERPADYRRHITPGLSLRGRKQYADLIHLVDETVTARRSRPFVGGSSCSRAPPQVSRRCSPLVRNPL